MKIRRGFVSNSSSTAFIITNKTKKIKSVVDFANETIHLVKEFNDDYDYDFTIEQFMQDAFARVVKSCPVKMRYYSVMRMEMWLGMCMIMLYGMAVKQIHSNGYFIIWLGRYKLTKKRCDDGRFE